VNSPWDFNDLSLGSRVGDRDGGRDSKDLSFCLSNTKEIIPVADVPGHFIIKNFASFENGDVATRW